MTSEVRSMLRGAAVVVAIGTIALGALSIVGLLGWDTARVQRTYAGVCGRCRRRGGVGAGAGGSLGRHGSGPAGPQHVVVAEPAADQPAAGGSVKVVGSTGRVSASASAGSVTGIALGSAEVSASSSGGSVRLDFAVDPTRVDGRSSAGSVLVQVPQDEMVYVVDASTSAGSRTVTVRTDPHAKRRITARSSAGSVRVSYRPAG